MQKIDYFLGIGQGKWAKKWLTKRVGHVSFHPAPNYMKYATVEDFEMCGLDWVKHSIGSGAASVIIAESQAAPAVVKAIRTNQITIPKQLILLQPLGLNASSLGSNDTQRLASLLKRSWGFWLQKRQSLLIYGNIRTLVTICLSAIRHPTHAKLAFQFGANQNCIADLEWIATRTKVVVCAAEEDGLFPYREIEAVPNKHVILRQTNSGHVNRATPQGIKELQAILGGL